MKNGLSNKITGQIGEYLVCAQLGKLGYIATSFTGNVPEFDIIITDENLCTIPVQVKTTNGESWPTKADLWINIEIDEINKLQIDMGNKKIDNPDLIYVCVMLSNINDSNTDRYFILTKSDLQNICAENYREYMNSKNWKRPKNYKSLDNRYNLKNLIKYENNWNLIKETIIQKQQYDV